MKQWFGWIAIVMIFCLGNGAAVSQTGKIEENGERATDEEQSGLHVPNPSVAEYRRWLRHRSPRQLGLAKNCESVTHEDLRVGLLLAMPKAPMLILGQKYDLESGEKTTKIEQVRRIYEVQRFTKVGSPFQGHVTIILKPDVAGNERVCLGRLQKSSIKWVTLRDDSDVEETIEMVVENVTFSSGGKVAASGATIPTGEIVARVTLSESWWSMAYRKSKEQIWGALLGMAGSVLLMAIGFIVRRIVRSRQRA